MQILAIHTYASRDDMKGSNANRKAKKTRENINISGRVAETTKNES